MSAPDDALLRGRLRAGEAMIVLIGVWLVLALLPLRVVMRMLWFRPGPVGVPSEGVDALVMHPVGQAVMRAARRLPVSTRCLHQALAGAVMLRRRRLPAAIVFGVRRKQGTTRAHAWLFCEGVPVLGGNAFAPFTPLAGFG